MFATWSFSQVPLIAFLQINLRLSGRWFRYNIPSLSRNFSYSSTISPRLAVQNSYSPLKNPNMKFQCTVPSIFLFGIALAWIFWYILYWTNHHFRGKTTTAAAIDRTKSLACPHWPQGTQRQGCSPPCWENFMMNIHLFFRDPDVGKHMETTMPKYAKISCQILSFFLVSLVCDIQCLEKHSKEIQCTGIYQVIPLGYLGFMCSSPLDFPKPTIRHVEPMSTRAIYIPCCSRVVCPPNGFESSLTFNPQAAAQAPNPTPWKCCRPCQRLRCQKLRTSPPSQSLDHCENCTVQ